MAVKMHFNYKDVPRAARFGFSAKKIYVQFLGLLVGTILYSIFAYIGFLASGYSITEVWDTFHYVPIPIGEPLTFWGYVFLYTGLALFVIVEFLFGVAISKITYEQLKGDEFYEIKKALKFAFTEGRAAVFTPITIILVIIFILLGGVVLGLIGKIPWVGELVLLLMSVPVVFTVVFIVYLFFALILAYYLVAPIVAVTNSDTFDALFELFSTLNDQNWRFVAYEAFLYVIKPIAFGIFAWAIAKGLYIAHWVLSAGWLMGDKYVKIEKAALSYLPSHPALYVFEPVLRIIGATPLLYPQPVANLTVPEAIVGFLFGILLYFIIFVALSYWGAIHWAGNTLIFVVLAKKKDDINYLEVKEEEEEFEETFEEESEGTQEESFEEGKEETGESES